MKKFSDTFIVLSKLNFLINLIITQTIYLFTISSFCRPKNKINFHKRHINCLRIKIIFKKCKSIVNLRRFLLFLKPITSHHQQHTTSHHQPHRRHQTTNHTPHHTTNHTPHHTFFQLPLINHGIPPSKTPINITIMLYIC